MTSAKATSADSSAPTAGTKKAPSLHAVEPIDSEHPVHDAKPVNAKSLPVRSGESPWTKAELNEVRKVLEEDIARFESQIEISTAELVGLLRDGSEGAGRDPADVGSANFERDAEMSLANNARHHHKPKYKLRGFAGGVEAEELDRVNDRVQDNQG